VKFIVIYLLKYNVVILKYFRRFFGSWSIFFNVSFWNISIERFHRYIAMLATYWDKCPAVCEMSSFINNAVYANRRIRLCASVLDHWRSISKWPSLGICPAANTAAECGHRSDSVVARCMSRLTAAASDCSHVTVMCYSAPRDVFVCLVGCQTDCCLISRV